MIEEYKPESEDIRRVMERCLNSGIVIDLIGRDRVKGYGRRMKWTFEKFEEELDNIENYLRTNDKMKEMAEDLKKRIEVKAEEQK